MFDLNKIKKKKYLYYGPYGFRKTIMRDLSKYLNIKFFDTDNEIELKTKKYRKDFAENGEGILEKLKRKSVLNY